MSSLAPWVALFPLALPASGVEVKLLEVAKADDVTYFRVILKAPTGLVVSDPDALATPTEKTIRRFGQRPRLVPLDAHVRTVHFDHYSAEGGKVSELSFVGKRVGTEGSVTLRLVYPIAAKPKEGLAGLPADADVATAEVRLNLAKAEWSAQGRQLRTAWARGQASYLYLQHLRSPGMGFFRLAYELNHRKYRLDSGDKLTSPMGQSGSLLESLLGGQGDQLFEMTTGATALTESLALSRLRPREKADKPARTRSVQDIKGIDIAEHPWKKMMGDRKPIEEPLARLVPCDNWYFTIHDPAAFLSASQVMDTWGGSVLRSPKLLDRDHGIRARYEQQLCLSANELIRELPAGLVRGMALTGSDLFFLEGTDVTVLLDVAFPASFTKVQDLHIAGARKAHGKQLQETKETYRGTEIQGFATPRREVSLYRASQGNVVICSNSPTAIRHILDVHAGKRTSLADSLDFQYMRTVFRRDAKQEDGFAFLSDPFVRRLVSPATRIKKLRRQDARAAMQLASHAALFIGIDDGKMPNNTKALLEGAALKPNVLTIPDGQPVSWEGTMAASDVYNTLVFSTPLVELPIDAVSPDEARDYERFREEYRRLWRRFFDPIGIRFKLGPGPARIEVYLLPLVNNSAYNELRSLTGGGTVRYSPSRIPATTVLRFLVRLPVEMDWSKKTGIGDWAYFHVDAKGLDLAPIVRYGIESELGHKVEYPNPEQVPFLLSMGVADVNVFPNSLLHFLLGKARPVVRTKHREITVNEYNDKKDLIVTDRLYDTIVDKAYALTWNRSLLERWIDNLLDAPKGKPKDEVEVNTALYLAPPGGKNVEAISAALEWETHKKALSAVAAWQALYAAGAISPTMSAQEKAAVARRLLGYVPASPDSTAFVFDTRLGQMKNERHGSLSRPAYHAALAPGSSVTQLFSQVRSVRVDLRFREDGIHTTMTLDWTAARK